MAARRPLLVACPLPCPGCNRNKQVGTSGRSSLINDASPTSMSDLDVCRAGEVSQAGGRPMHMPRAAGCTWRHPEQSPNRSGRLLQQPGASLTFLMASGFCHRPAPVRVHSSFIPFYNECYHWMVFLPTEARSVCRRSCRERLPKSTPL